MAIHYSTKHCGSPDTIPENEKMCKCLMNVNGVCRRVSMQEMARLMLKDGNDDFVAECPYNKGYLMIAEFRVKSKLI